MYDQKGRLTLADGKSFSGTILGEQAEACGEVCFVTNMTGYLEIITDPCSAGLILVFTYPLIGNYGVTTAHSRDIRAWAKAVVVREICSDPSHFACEGTLQSYLSDQGVLLLSGVDTRAVARYLRQSGNQQGIILGEQGKDSMISATGVSSPEQPYAIPASHLSYIPPVGTPKRDCKIAVFDFGSGNNLARELLKAGFSVDLYPPTIAVDEMMACNPAALMISDGAGDSATYINLSKSLLEICEQLPVFGFGLGMHLLAEAFGISTHKMPLGHRGSNYPVMALGKNLDESETQLTLINQVSDNVSARQYQERKAALYSTTTQNHGYSICEESLEGTEWEVTHRHLHDYGIEGMRHTRLPLWGLQYFPDCSVETLEEKAELSSFWRSIEQTGERSR
ncbi:MAG: carbamoyl phosphate synthase small subunit [Symbiobacteriaceae bacterium]|nr:carbamoyl phosphate synthase small subunit [Symbiobacteriaceae bacterium]